MESGYVKFFLTSPEKLFGFLVDEMGNEIFFHYSNGRAVAVKAPGEVKLVEPTHPLQYPKKGEYLLFTRSSNGKGPKASPWCFVRDFNEAIAQSTRNLTLEEAQQLLSNKPCDIFEYTDTSCPNGIDLEIVVTEISWLTSEGKPSVARGKFVTATDSFRGKVLKTETKARVEVFTPNEKQYTSSTIFTGAHAITLKEKLNIRNSKKGARAGILWNGGWDDYVVDPTSVRDMTPEENIPTCCPTLGNEPWLRCSFARDYGNDNQVVKILRHLGGGD